jgi:hypothetical protein
MYREKFSQILVESLNPKPIDRRSVPVPECGFERLKRESILAH